MNKGMCQYCQQSKKGARDANPNLGIHDLSWHNVHGVCEIGMKANPNIGMDTIGQKPNRGDIKEYGIHVGHHREPKV